MSFHDIEIQSEDNTFAPIVKNTFITLTKPFVCATRRLKSVPASLRLFPESDDSFSYEAKVCRADSDISNDEWTEASTCYEEDDGMKTPLVSDSEDSFSVASLPMSPMRQRPTMPTPLNFVPPLSILSTQPTTAQAEVPPPPPGHFRTPLRLNSKAPAFKPMTQASDDMLPHYKFHIAKVVKTAMDTLQKCALASHVQILENPRDCTITLKTKAAGELARANMLAAAKQALSDAAAQSKCIFVMGFAAPDPFTMTPLGFEATLGAMENAKTACWHVFKKGFCRHESGCRMQHAVAKVPVRVVVESAEFKAPVAAVIDFKDSVADLVSTVTNALQKSHYAAKVEACADVAAQSWSIEVSGIRDTPAQQELMLAFAKQALLDTSARLGVVDVIGRTAKPFAPKSNGFVAVIGEMQPENKICWDYYSSGFCRKGCACKWEHPACQIPVSVHIK